MLATNAILIRNTDIAIGSFAIALTLLDLIMMILFSGYTVIMLIVRHAVTLAKKTVVIHRVQPP